MLDHLNTCATQTKTTHVVSCRTGGKSILSKGGNAGLESPDADTLCFGAGHEHVLLSTEVSEWSRANRITRRMSQDDCSAVEQNARLALFHQNQQVQVAVRGQQRLARDAVSQAVLDSSARLE